MKRYIISLSILLASCSWANAQIRWNQTYQDYIDRYKDIAIEQMLLHRIPASITLAQGLLESGAGRSKLAVSGNNHFGIKCHEWNGPRMYKDDDMKNDCFRVYDSPRESYEDHSKFLQRSRYSSLYSLSLTDYKGWARGLKACGYATNPKYADNLINIIEAYNLQQYDYARSYATTQQPTAPQVAQVGSGHAVYYRNKNYYVVARQGDTFKSIAGEFDMSYRKLAKYNERDKKDVLNAGDIVYMEKKRSKAEKAYKKQPHVVRAGESMYDIAQLYGIRLKYLYKKNRLPENYAPKAGDVLKVY